MSNLEIIPQATDIETLKEVSDTTPVTEEPTVPPPKVQSQSMKSEQFRDDVSGWVSAMYNELVDDIIGIIPDEDVCKLQSLYEQTLDVIKNSKIDDSRLP